MGVVIGLSLLFIVGGLVRALFLGTTGVSSSKQGESRWY